MKIFLLKKRRQKPNRKRKQRSLTLRGQAAVGALLGGGGNELQTLLLVLVAVAPADDHLAGDGIVILEAAGEAVAGAAGALHDVHRLAKARIPDLRGGEKKKGEKRAEREKTRV